MAMLAKNVDRIRRQVSTSHAGRRIRRSRRRTRIAAVACSWRCSGNLISGRQIAAGAHFHQNANADADEQHQDQHADQCGGIAGRFSNRRRRRGECSGRRRRWCNPRSWAGCRTCRRRILSGRFQPGLLPADPALNDQSRSHASRQRDGILTSRAKDCSGRRSHADLDPGNLVITPLTDNGLPPAIFQRHQE